jgi:hypothetical protein
MDCLNTENCLKFCKDHSIEILDGKFLRFADQSCAIEVLIPKLTLKAMTFAYSLLKYDEEEKKFQGALLWFKDWDIWGESVEEPAMKLWQSIRLAHGEKAPFIEKPGHLFGAEEFLDMHALFSLPLLFGWDMYLIPDHGDYFIFVSHDEVLYIVTRTDQIKDKFLAYLEHWDPKVRRLSYV